MLPRQSSRLTSTPYKLIKDHHVFVAEHNYSGEDSMCTLITLDGLTESISLSEVVQDLWWSNAIQAELAALHKNHTWDLVPLPPSKKALSAKWVLKMKPDVDLALHRMKACLVAKGYEQREAIDYNENFAPVVKWSTVRSIVALAATLH